MLNTAFDKSRSALVEVEGGGGLVSEENPTALVSPLQLFISASSRTAISGAFGPRRAS